MKQKIWKNCIIQFLYVKTTDMIRHKPNTGRLAWCSDRFHRAVSNRKQETLKRDSWRWVDDETEALNPVVAPEKRTMVWCRAGSITLILYQLSPEEGNFDSVQ
jgi:hypothetical protein